MRLDPRVQWLWTVELAVMTVAAAVLAGLVVGLVDPPDAYWAVPAAVLAVGLAVTLAYPAARYRRFGYDLTDHALQIRRGVAWRREEAVPYFRVQHIDVAQGPAERALGLARLVVHTAAARADASLPGIAAADAPELRQVMLARTVAAVAAHEDERRDAV